MPTRLVVLPERLYFSDPQDIFAVLGWLLLIVLVIVFLKRLWEPLNYSNKRNLIVYAVLAVLAPLFTAVAGIEIGKLNVSPLPNLPFEVSAPILFLLFAVPWQIAAGLLGVGPAVIIGLISGFCLGGWYTHNYVSIIETAAMALVFAYLIRQNYRTKLFKVLRYPFAAALAVSILFLPLLVFDQFLSVSGSLAVRLDYGLSQTFNLAIIRSTEVIIGGIICTAFLFSAKSSWIKPQNLVPSPIERKIEYRFLFGTLPFIFVLLFALIYSDWKVAGGAARNMVEERLKSTAEVTAESLPYFIEAGQNLLFSFADKQIMDQGANTSAIMAEKIRTVPFFRQLFLFDASGNPLDGYPIREFDQILPTNDELSGIRLAQNGVTIQSYALPPWIDEETTQISFIVSIKDDQDQVTGILLGRTDLNSNPFTRPAIDALRSATRDNGEGLILDDQNRILFQTTSVPETLLRIYAGDLPNEPGLFENVSPKGTRQIVYYQPLAGSGWSVLISTPAQEAQELALGIATPLLIILSFIVGLAFLSLRLSLRPITKTLNTLSKQASMISSGNLDNPVVSTSVDEFGQLAISFEQMRIRLKDRLDELRQLLIASQSVAEHLEITEAIEPILTAALSNGGISARVVLNKQVVLDHQHIPYLAIGVGINDTAMNYLDTQLYNLLRDQDIITIPNLPRMSRFSTPVGATPPGALLGVALYHENEYFGVLWVAYSKPRSFSEEEIRFISTLASQAGIAAANAKLYATAETGRQRLEAILNSTPEPVMVFDEEDKLLLINPAAIQVGGLIKSSTTGNNLEEVINNEVLFDLLANFKINRDVSREIKLSNDRVYFTSISSVNRNGRMVGKVCILRDITHFRELDTLKSDVVATVSHDLRSPLTLMRGYASMFQMVGETNDQQRSYAAKIISSVDTMTKLVNNLLDMGRLEAGIALNIEEINPIKLTQQIVNDQLAQANHKNIQLNFMNQLKGDEIIFADPALIQQAVINLVDNALKYTPMGGEVTIILREKDKLIEFEIKDSGIGVAPIDLPRLFDKFYRSNRRESYKHQGTGLGLAIVKSIVERHNGRVWVESKLGRGSSFFFEIPKHR
jgi:PAS domain S-box-containing protein